MLRSPCSTFVHPLLKTSGLEYSISPSIFGWKPESSFHHHRVAFTLFSSLCLRIKLLPNGFWCLSGVLFSFNLLLLQRWSPSRCISLFSTILLAFGWLWLYACPELILVIWRLHLLSVCDGDRARVCYQEAAKRNRGNSTGLLQADSKRAEAECPCGTPIRVYRALIYSHTTLIYGLSHIHNLSTCQSPLRWIKS